MKNHLTTEQFQDETRRYIEGTPLSKRKEHGQYFTPAPLRKKLLDLIPPLSSPRIVDPAVGTGEFLADARDYFDRPDLTGWDIDEELVELARQVVPEADISRRNALNEPFTERFDLVVGNPPYYEFKPEKKLRSRYEDVIHGRVNIYGLFFKLGLEMLKPGGILAYVVSTSMNNGAYFSALRDFITSRADIQHLEILDDHDLFEGAQQSVMLIVLKKQENTGRYIFGYNGHRIFSEKAEALKDTFSDKTTLAERGWTVKTGRVVWNQNRDKLTRDKEKGVPLIWSYNITNDGLTIPHDEERPQYIKWENTRTGPAIVVNRVTGTGKHINLRAGYVPPDVEFTAENHVNVVIPPPDCPDPEKQCQNVLAELRNPENTDALKHIIGNTQVSATELRELFPLGIR